MRGKFNNHTYKRANYKGTDQIVKIAGWSVPLLFPFKKVGFSHNETLVHSVHTRETAQSNFNEVIFTMDYPDMCHLTCSVNRFQNIPSIKSMHHGTTR